jgi:hypothetical protein
MHTSRFLLGLSFVASIVASRGHGHPGHEEEPLVVAQAGERPVRREPGHLENRVSISTEGEFRVMRSNGIPDHAPGAFPRRGNPNAIAPQDYTFRIPLRPKLSEQPVVRGNWWWGVALNGVPFEPGTAEAWKDDPRTGWRYEAGTGFLNLGLDEHNAHVQPNGSYHYHALPTGHVALRGGEGERMVQIGWAADGFPVYTGWAYSDAKDAKSPLRKVKSSYQLKKGMRPPEPEGPGGAFDGRFTRDFEFVKESGDLDEANGRHGVTPEFPEGTYYYCVSPEFPFVARMWRGVPDASFSKGERPNGGPGRPPGPGGPGVPQGIMENGPGEPPRPRGIPPIVGALDTNRDGVIDSAEIDAASKALRSLDKNGDGKLSGEEFRPNPGGPPQF